jgi:hypothetical protein
MWKVQFEFLSAQLNKAFKMPDPFCKHLLMRAPNVPPGKAVSAKIYPYGYKGQ